ncbi:4-hydroxyphenylpyruvate dioxygenase [Roseiarcaceae bacterium H3SJ34-1]|uniref:4-hydroxyphenylpyruvate dioxygenase n=1 Tax=Terripilifer ovatus TaxID=3032367 RepID=UPI003AB9733A|nr:4-hydroxyphenylpyruvate dioxygenase [Roseiarcaceae bacterium H3SJ34-1]
MGPFPHGAPPAAISADNPASTDGFAFVEFAHPDPEKLHALFRLMGFSVVARHGSNGSTLYRQGDIDYLVSVDPAGQAARFAAQHGPSVPSMGFRVVDARHAYERAVANGAEPYEPADGSKTLDVPAVRGIGGSLLYFVDTYGDKGSAFDAEFTWLGERDPHPEGRGLFYIDHLTHNVHRGRMDVWTDFYKRIFNFRQIRYFDIEGKMTGLFSRALTSPDGRIRIPINESADAKSQIEEYLHQYKGEGIQHIAMGCRDIFETVEGLRAGGLPFMPAPPQTYYERVAGRLPGHGQDIARLTRSGILIDGEGVVENREARILLQIFSANMVGPVFFEFIERKGDEGFGEGNFRALFESIEEDQIRRGVLKPGKAA